MKRQIIDFNVSIEDIKQNITFKSIWTPIQQKRICYTTEVFHKNNLYIVLYFCPETVFMWWNYGFTNSWRYITAYSSVHIYLNSARFFGLSCLILFFSVPRRFSIRLMSGDRLGYFVFKNTMSGIVTEKLHFGLIRPNYSLIILISFLRMFFCEIWTTCNVFFRSWEFYEVWNIWSSSVKSFHSLLFRRIQDKF